MSTLQAVLKASSIHLDSSVLFRHQCEPQASWLGDMRDNIRSEHISSEINSQKFTEFSKKMRENLLLEDATQRNKVMVQQSTKKKNWMEFVFRVRTCDASWELTNVVAWFPRNYVAIKATTMHHKMVCKLIYDDDAVLLIFRLELTASPELFRQSIRQVSAWKLA